MTLFVTNGRIPRAHDTGDFSSRGFLREWQSPTIVESLVGPVCEKNNPLLATGCGLTMTRIVFRDFDEYADAVGA